MHYLSNIYIFLYFFYSYFGYNCLYRLIENKNIDYALLDYRSYAYIGKRLCMLSHIAFLYSAYFLENPSVNRYINVLLLHNVVNIGYYVKWGSSELTTFIFHIIWAIPVSYYGFDLFYYNGLYYCKLNYENYFMIIFLLYYSQIFNYIYTPRIPFLDNPS